MGRAAPTGVCTRETAAPASGDLVQLVRSSLIGQEAEFLGPFGKRRVVYADYTASGRSLTFIEDYIREIVLPFYANTHTEASTTGLQTTKLREEARRLIREAVGASDDYVVIFCGSGSTAAINKLVDILELRIPHGLDQRYGLSRQIPAADRPVVFIGPYEHHSNELPWRESIAEVVVIGENAEGLIDTDQLRSALEAHRGRQLLIGSFSAASNVTGLVSDWAGITRLLKEHGALACWDFAAAGPYVPIEMAPEAGSAAMDAVFLSPHKLVGGPGTPGVLVVRRDLVQNSVPTMPGGGTVQFVSATSHRYLEDRQHREEGGTPAIIESIRAGLVFQLKARVGAERIRGLEAAFAARAIGRWRALPALQLLGNLEAERLSITSFRVGAGELLLHHNFVVALLNDLFGIQSRGGCSCAGPYGHRLLGVDAATSAAIDEVTLSGLEGIKPGWTRLNFNYFIPEWEFEYIVAAVEQVAEHGWKLLPDYRFDPRTGAWKHVSELPQPQFSLLDPVRPEVPAPLDEAERRRLAEACLREAKQLFGSPAEPPRRVQQASLDLSFERLRWFWMPNEVARRGDR